MASPAAPPTLTSVSPVTGRPLGTVPRTAPDDVAAAVREARAVQRLWWQLRARDRARYMARAAQAVIDEADELAALIGAEQGRPRTEIEVMELLPAIETLQWLAEEGPGVLAGERVSVSRALRPFTRARWSYEPLGVVAVLGPATEAFATPLGDIAVALMAGNGVVCKPSPHAALAGERIARVFARAGLPEGLLQVVHGGAEVGAALVDARVDQVRFTGSLASGRVVLEACARGLKRSVLELGGKDAMLVLADANVPRAIDGALWGAFANAGQSGGSIERAYVLQEAFPRFLAGVVAGAQGLRVGDPRDPATAIGPLVDPARRERVQELVDDAVAQGATLHCGGAVEPAGVAGACFAPAVLTGVTPAMRLAREEVPGPVLAVHAVETEEAAIAGANDSDLGLGASVWTTDRFKGARIARELQVGMVWMNDHLVSRTAPQLPVGRGRRLGPRPRPGRDRAAHLRGAEGRDLGPARRAPLLVVPLRRDAGPRGARGERAALGPRRGPRAGAEGGRRRARAHDDPHAPHPAPLSAAGPARAPARGQRPRRRTSGVEVQASATLPRPLLAGLTAGVNLRGRSWDPRSRRRERPPGRRRRRLGHPRFDARCAPAQHPASECGPAPRFHAGCRLRRGPLGRGARRGLRRLAGAERQARSGRSGPSARARGAAGAARGARTPGSPAAPGRARDPSAGRSPCGPGAAGCRP